MVVSSLSSPTSASRTKPKIFSRDFLPKTKRRKKKSGRPKGVKKPLFQEDFGRGNQEVQLVTSTALGTSDNMLSPQLPSQQYLPGTPTTLFSVGVCPGVDVPIPTSVGAEGFLGVDLTIRLDANPLPDARPHESVDSFLEGLASGPYSCMVASRVLEQGKGIGFRFGREDEAEIRRIMLLEEKDSTAKRQRESSVVGR